MYNVPVSHNESEALVMTVLAMESSLEGSNAPSFSSLAVYQQRIRPVGDFSWLGPVFYSVLWWCWHRHKSGWNSGGTERRIHKARLVGARNGVQWEGSKKPLPRKKFELFGWNGVLVNSEWYIFENLGDNLYWHPHSKFWGDSSPLCLVIYTSECQISTAYQYAQVLF